MLCSRPTRGRRRLGPRTPFAQAPPSGWAVVGAGDNQGRTRVKGNPAGPGAPGPAVAADGGDAMRLVPEEVPAFLGPEFAARQGELTGYSLDLLEHPAAGWCLRNYLLLTEFPDLLADLRLSEAELFWSRYYWLARYGQVLKAAGPGNDGGVEEELAYL